MLSIRACAGIEAHIHKASFGAYLPTITVPAGFRKLGLEATRVKARFSPSDSGVSDSGLHSKKLSGDFGLCAAYALYGRDAQLHCTSPCTYIHLHMCIYTHVKKYIYIYIYIYTYTYAYLYQRQRELERERERVLF